MRSVVVEVPAKVNLALCVGPARADGFHELATVYQAVSLYDIVTATARADGEVRIKTTAAEDGPDIGGVPDDATNLAVRAAEALRRATGVEQGVDLAIAKAIPVAGGMAGGSADAAAALVACNELWATGLDTEALATIAAELGSDVPFLLHGGTAIGSGRGEIITPLEDNGTYHWVFVISGDGLSTPAVYREFDLLRPHAPAPRVPEPLTTALRSGDAKAVGSALVNDLMAPALSLRPSLRTTVEQCADTGAIAVLVSGSGPTIAALYETVEDADAARSNLCALHDPASVLVVRAAVGGARVISS